MHHPATRTLLGLGLAGLVAGVGLGIARATGAEISPALPIAVFLLGFGLLKFAFAADALIGVRQGATPDPRDGQSSPSTFALWVSFRFLVAIVAILAAAGLAFWPKAAERLF